MITWRRGFSAGRDSCNGWTKPVSEKAALKGEMADSFPDPGMRRQGENFTALAGIG